MSKAYIPGALHDATEIKTEEEKEDGVRGYFDTEGRVSEKHQAGQYIYFAQKDRNDIEKVKKIPRAARNRVQQNPRPN